MRSRLIDPCVMDELEALAVGLPVIDGNGVAGAESETGFEFDIGCTTPVAIDCIMEELCVIVRS